MPGCVLRVLGGSFDVDAFLAHSTLEPYEVHRRGEARRKTEVFTDSGFCIDVSEVNGKISDEVIDAIQFLSTHTLELHRLQQFPGVTELTLDFGYYARRVLAQYDYLPPALLIRAGSLGIGIKLSLYHSSDVH